MRPHSKTENLRISIYPWDLRSWSAAFRIAGIPGYVLLALLLGALIQYVDVTGVGGGPGHASAASLLFVRAPLCIAAFILLLSQPRVASLRLKDARFLFLAFGLLYFVSTLWSAQKLETLGKATEILLATLCFLQVSRSENALQRVDALRQIILLTISLVALITFTGFCLRIPSFIFARPGLFTPNTATSPFLSGNGMGYVSSALFLVIFAEWQAKRIRLAPAARQMLFALALFSVAASRTSFAILIVSILLVVSRKSRVLGVALTAATVALLAVFRERVLDFLQGSEASSNFTTLSGRTVVWTAAIRQWRENPWFGVGGGVGGKAGHQTYRELFSRNSELSPQRIHGGPDRVGSGRHYARSVPPRARNLAHASHLETLPPVLWNVCADCSHLGVHHHVDWHLWMDGI